MKNNCNNKEFPLITIGVSAYNRMDYLPFCLDSLLNQTYPNCEIIVVDDGSTDGTAEMMKEKYPHVQYFRKENGGDASAKNYVANVAKGKYLVFNDSDDVFYPDTVEKLYNALPSDDETACSYGTYQTIDADGNEMPTKRKMSFFPSGKITEPLLSHIIINSCGPLIPTRFFLDCGSYNDKLRVCHDWALFLEMSVKCRFYAVQEPVFKRRRHGSNISSATYDKEKIVWDVFENFLKKHPELETLYAATVKKRRGDFHRKLYREAMKEKRFSEVRFHAKEAFRFSKTLKNFSALLYSVLFLK